MEIRELVRYASVMLCTHLEKIESKISKNESNKEGLYRPIDGLLGLTTSLELFVLIEPVKTL
jgi:hypothetical protein